VYCLLLENYIALLPTKNLGQLNRDSMSEFELMYMIINDSIGRNDRNLNQSLVAESNHKRPLLCRWLLANIRNEVDHHIDIYNTCALSKHRGNMCMRLRNAGKGEASPSLFSRFAPNTHIYLYASTVHMYCIYPAILNRK
jgi:hypothetical protein